MKADDEGERDMPSTGFLPLSLALGLFITGLFMLGFVSVPTCGEPHDPAPSATP